MGRKTDKKELLKCYDCMVHFEYKKGDVKFHRTWFPLWLGGYEYSYVACPCCGEHLIVGGMR